MNKEIARYRRIVTKINKLESKTSRLKDAEIAVKFSLLKIRHQKGETLDNLMCNYKGQLQHMKGRL